MDKIFIHEVGMRDGLQVEQQTVPTETKIKWIDELIKTGVDIIQVGSFVHPVKVPTMADTDALFKHYSDKGKPENVILSGLVLNEKGLERGLACGVDMFCMGVSASETHSKKNTGMSTLEALDRIIATAKNAKSAVKEIQVSVQSAFGCGFEGKIPEEKVIGIIEKYLENDIKMISLADTAGHAYPEQVENLITEIYKLSDDIKLAVHFHDTYGLGIANCYTSFKMGVRYFESAFAGLGGCPFTAKASGNVCTEDLVNMFQRMGVCTDIDIQKILDVSKEAENFYGRELPSKILEVGIIKQN
ncbi:MAG: hydroxymethylglutaryl-CoA lyase [Ignavibacteriae bacterium]|nr:hydroxymethylglutaryl-CoA lyase [Ignavibacteriota bacterium]